MDQGEAAYEEKYTEHNLLGRGNYGSAYVVQSNINGKLFVAKKMLLSGMTEAEIGSAKGQIQILEKFSDTRMYPFIVKYIQCFVFQKTLVIIMEYCEHGDLAGFIKYAKKKEELLDEKVVVAWFIMLAMGIQALHSKNILHRDLKSANIFLTSNKFIKIGDFGISKVLENTTAQTFVGTPYYLSPEICSNKKYDFRSDIWSLGCILYELCTLNYPFNATNILSLALKITSQEVAPIPKKYSKQLNDILMGLLNKDQNKRLTIEQALSTPYMRKFMNENGSRLNEICQSIPLKKTNKIQVSNPDTKTIKSNQTSQDETMKTIKSNFYDTSNNHDIDRTMKSDTLSLSNTSGLTPKEMMKMRKEEQARKEEEQLKQAIKDKMNDSDQREFTKNQKKKVLEGGKFGETINSKTLNIKYMKENKQKAEEKKQKIKNGLGDNQSIDLGELFELTSKIKNLGITQNYSQITLPKGVEEKIFLENKNFKKYTETVEETEGEYDEDLEEYYDQEFEDYVPQQKPSSEALVEKDAVNTFMSVVSGNAGSLSPTKRAVVEKAFEKKAFGPRTQQEKKEQAIQDCIDLVTQEKYHLLYALVSKCYKNQKYYESEELKQLRTTGSKKQKQALRLIEEIKYYEMME